MNERTQQTKRNVRIKKVRRTKEIMKERNIRLIFRSYQCPTSRVTPTPIATNPSMTFLNKKTAEIIVAAAAAVQVVVVSAAAVAAITLLTS